MEVLVTTVELPLSLSETLSTNGWPFPPSSFEICHCVHANICGYQLKPSRNFVPVCVNTLFLSGQSFYCGLHRDHKASPRGPPKALNCRNRKTLSKIQKRRVFKQLKVWLKLIFVAVFLRSLNSSCFLYLSKAMTPSSQMNELVYELELPQVLSDIRGRMNFVFLKWAPFSQRHIFPRVISA